MPTLELTTMVGCPVRCDFCPQDALLANYPKGAKRMLSVEDWGVILPKIPKHVRIDFSGMAEPWANPHCSTLLGMTLDSGYSVAIYTTLQGMFPEDAEQVVAMLRDHRSQVEVVCLHLPDADGHMRNFKRDIEWDSCLGSFMRLRASKAIERFELMTMSGPRVMPQLGYQVHLPMWEGHDRAGSLDRSAPGPTAALEPMVRHGGPVSCSYTPFYDQNVLMPNGDVLLCCMDYGYSSKIGNLLSGTYETLQRYTIQHRNALEDVSCSNTICRKCNRATTYHQEPGNRQMWAEDKR